MLYNKNYFIRKVELSDVEEIFYLYKLVTKNNPYTLTLNDSEVTIDYIRDQVNKSLSNGIGLVLERKFQIIGFMKSFTSPFKRLSHILTNGTILIHTDYQSNIKGYGAILFKEHLNIIQNHMPHIMKFVIFPYESNYLAIKLYKKLGFSVDYIESNKIFHRQDYFDNEVVMSWENPNFSINELMKYHNRLNQQNDIDQNRFILQSNLNNNTSINY